MDVLNSFVRELVTLKAVSFNILTNIPSGSLVFVVSRVDRKSKISSSVHSRSSGHSSRVSAVYVQVRVVTHGCSMLL